MLTLDTIKLASKSLSSILGRAANRGKKFYHGGSSIHISGDRLMPPSSTGVIQEAGRKKNLNRVFFTTDRKSADIYAGRSVRRHGGKPIVREVHPMGDIVKLNDSPGTSVYHSKWGLLSS